MEQLADLKFTARTPSVRAKRMRVTVPAAVCEQAMLPAGHQMDVTIPENVGPGNTMDVIVPRLTSQTRLRKRKTNSPMDTDTIVPTGIHLSTLPASTFFARPGSSLGLWFQLILGLLGSVLQIIGLLIAVVGLPIAVILRRPAMKVFKFLFKYGYRIYLTSFGQWIHNRMVDAAHSTDELVNGHRGVIRPTHLNGCTIWPIPILFDNYSYLIIDHATNQAAAVDPAAPLVVLAFAKRLGVDLVTVFTTHGHHDHAGGNLKIKELNSGIEIVGCPSTNDREAIPALTKAAEEGDIISVGQTRVQVIETPCHTKGHLCYVVLPAAETNAGCSVGAILSSNAPTTPMSASTSEAQAVFTGDTMFVGGVGAFFHGTATDMLNSLRKLHLALPDTCKVFVGHEYSSMLLQLGAWVEPSNGYLQERFHWASTRDVASEPTVPSTMQWERRTNPWLRMAMGMNGDDIRDEHDAHGMRVRAELEAAVQSRLAQYETQSCWRRQMGVAPKDWLVVKTDTADEQRNIVFEGRSFLSKGLVPQEEPLEGVQQGAAIRQTTHPLTIAPSVLSNADRLLQMPNPLSALDDGCGCPEGPEAWIAGGEDGDSGAGEAMGGSVPNTPGIRRFVEEVLPSTPDVAADNKLHEKSSMGDSMDGSADPQGGIQTCFSDATIDIPLRTSDSADGSADPDGDAALSSLAVGAAGNKGQSKGDKASLEARYQRLLGLASSLISFKSASLTTGYNKNLAHPEAYGGMRLPPMHRDVSRIVLSNHCYMCYDSGEDWAPPPPSPWKEDERSGVQL
jgi:hydroxyacylglutathione hydrolase